MQLSTISLALTRLGGLFTPAGLFAGGVNGVWYDPSDLTTLFTTSAGTTQCAMPGQGSAVSVGLMLDKSQNGVGTNGAKRVNLLSWTEAFNDAVWTKVSLNTTGTPVWINTAVAPNGTTTADLLLDTVSSAEHYAQQSFPCVSGVSYTFSGYVKQYTYTTCVIRTWLTSSVVHNVDFSAGIISGGGTLTNVGNGWFRFEITRTASASGTAYLESYVKQTGAYAGTGTDGHYVWGFDVRLASEANTQPTYQRIDANWYSTMAGNHAIAINDSTARPELRARVNLLVATATLSTQSVTTQATSYTLRFAGTGSITLSGTATGSYSAGTHTITCTAGTLTLTVSGTVTTADLRPANSGALLPAYQAVVDANTYDTAGFPLYLYFDGADDGMYTPANLNLSATDKVGVFAGVRALQSAVQVVNELSAATGSNNGSFVLYKNSDGLGFSSQGTSLVTISNSSGFAPPVSLVLTGQSNITAPSLSLRSNGTQILSSTSSQGTGNFGTYPLYIGSRNNGSLWLNGQIYGLVIVGSAVSAGNISATESWMANKTGIVI